MQIQNIRTPSRNLPPIQAFCAMSPEMLAVAASSTTVVVNTVITSYKKVFKHEVNNTTTALTSRYSNGCHKNDQHKDQPTHNGKARTAISQVKENCISVI